VNYLFTRTGVIIVPRRQVTEDDILIAGLDAGIIDVTEDEETFTVITAPADVRAVRKALEEAGIAVSSSETTMLPSATVPVTEESVARQVLRLLDALEDCDDVQNVYSNFDIPDHILEAVA
jgi:transcriptional/translational regulatory protein YebC/TACO1